MSGPFAEVTASLSFCILSVVEGLRVRPSEVWLCPQTLSSDASELGPGLSLDQLDCRDDVMMFSAVPAVWGAGPAPPPSAEPLASPGYSQRLASPAPQPHRLLAWTHPAALASVSGSNEAPAAPATPTLAHRKAPGGLSDCYSLGLKNFPVELL